MNLETVRKIGDVLETSWGRSSSEDGTYSIKYALEGDLLFLKFTTLLTFESEAGLRPQINVANEQAKQLINAKISDVKSSYKQANDELLSLKDLGGADDLELISPVGPKKYAYYRYNHSYNVQS